MVSKTATPTVKPTASTTSAPTKKKFANLTSEKLFHFTDKDCVYEGEMHDNQRHGQGTLTHSNGYTFQGEFLKGLMNGYGKWSHLCGDYLEGFYSEGQLNGQGSRMILGETYEGEFMNNLPHGYGVCRESNGTTYEGDFEQGVYHGYGTWKQANGTIYSGDFQNGVKDGAGVLTFPNGTKYEGGFKVNERSGPGKITYPNGDILTGNFVSDSIKTGLYTYSANSENKEMAGTVVPWEAKAKKGKKEKQDTSTGASVALVATTPGKLTHADPIIAAALAKLPLDSVTLPYPDGVYHGEVYNNNVRCGYGIMLYEGGSAFLGKWFSDQPSGSGYMKYVSNNVLTGTYRGRWAEGKYHGVGTLVTIVTDSQDPALQTQIIYDGEFEKGLRCGKGKVHNGNALTYHGHFANDQYHGVGFLREEIGFYKGAFENGEKHGKGMQNYQKISGAKTLEPFVGTFKNNLPYTGTGSVVRPTGIFEGKLIEGKEEGPGQFTSLEDKSVIKGVWANGEITSGELFDEAGMYFSCSSIRFVV